MSRRRPLLLLLGSACGFLASLYLPWQTAGGRSCGRGCYQSALVLDAWGFGIGQVAALIGLGLAGAAAAALLRPGWARRLPLGRCALALAYFALAVGAAVRTEGTIFGTYRHVDWSYGSYVALACAALAVSAAATLRARELAQRPSASTVESGLLGLGLLVSFLLPWFRFQPGILATAAVLAALVVLFGGTGRPAGAAAALLTGGAFSGNVPGTPRAYGAWLALGFALSLLAFAAFAARGKFRRPDRVGGAWVAAAAAVFVVSLFLPWETICAASGGRCVSVNGWSGTGSVASLLVLLAFVPAPALSRRGITRVELAVGTALLVATAGFAVRPFPGPRFDYGSFVAFAAAGIFVLLALGRLRAPRFDRERLADRTVPLAASLLLMLGVLIPSWYVLPSDWASQSGVLLEWFAVAGLLLSLHLLGAWVRAAERPSSRDAALTLVPVAVLALVVLAIVRFRSFGLTWGGGILIGLCVVLLAFGWFERRQGLENLRLPELLRVDRLPGAES